MVDQTIPGIRSGEHTPGPWMNGFDNLEGVFSLGATDSGNVVCLPPIELMELSYERWPANARLIAAAPDLLGALRKIDAQVSHGHLGDWSIALGEIRKIARAAIAKAGAA